LICLQVIFIALINIEPAKGGHDVNILLPSENSDIGNVGVAEHIQNQVTRHAQKLKIGRMFSRFA
jgi:hypothetical protein